MREAGASAAGCAVTKTCLLLTDRFEATADLLIAALRRRGVACVRWNLDTYPLDGVLTYRLSDDRMAVELGGDGRRLDLAEVGSIWCRGLTPSGFAEDLNPADRAFAELGARRALGALTTVSDALWVNAPDRLVRANSKPAQLDVARRLGLIIPDTLVTNDPGRGARLHRAGRRSGHL